MTRVVRLLAEGTIEEAIVALQKRKLEAGWHQANAAVVSRHELDASVLITLINEHPKSEADRDP